MQEKIQSWFNRILGKWHNLESRQKVHLASAVVAVALALGVAVWLFLRPNMQLASQYMDPGTAAEVRSVLTSEGIRHNYTSDGKLYIEEGRTLEGIAVLESRNVSGLEKYSFAEAFANSSMGTTQTMQKASLNRAKEGWLGSVLQNFKDVTQANVSLNIPDDSNFLLQPEQEAQAAVQLVVKAEISRANGENMARFISKNVPNLKLENISIIDQNYNAIYNGDSAGTGGYSQQSDVEMLFTRNKENSVRNAFKGTLYNDIKIISNFEFNWDKIQEESLRYEAQEGQDKGFVVKEQNERQSGTNTDASAAPGLDANNAQTPTYQTNDGASSEVKINNSTIEYVYNAIKTQTTPSTGNWLSASSSMGIVAYNFRTYNEAELTQNDMLNGMTWAQYKAGVPAQTRLDVDPDFVDFLKASTGINNLLVLAYEIPIFEDAVVEPMDIRIIVLLVLLGLFILMLAYGLIKRTQPDEIEEIEPELSVEDLLVSTQIDEQKVAELEKLRDIELGEDSEIKKQIMKFVTEKPEAVAGLLRNWLNDEWD